MEALTSANEEPQTTVLPTPAKRPKCSALNKRGEPCQAWAIRDSDLCHVHHEQAQGREVFGGLGPVEAARRHGEIRRGRAEVRRMLIPSGPIGPRSILRAEVLRQHHPLAQRIVAEALKEDNGIAGAALGLKLIDAVDPMVETTLSATGPLPQTQEQWDALTPEQKDAFALSMAAGR